MLRSGRCYNTKTKSQRSRSIRNDFHGLDWASLNPWRTSTSTSTVTLDKSPKERLMELKRLENRYVEEEKSVLKENKWNFVLDATPFEFRKLETFVEDVERHKLLRVLGYTPEGKRCTRDTFTMLEERIKLVNAALFFNLQIDLKCFFQLRKFYVKWMTVKEWSVYYRRKFISELMHLVSEIKAYKEANKKSESDIKLSYKEQEKRIEELQQKSVARRKRNKEIRSRNMERRAMWERGEISDFSGSEEEESEPDESELTRKDFVRPYTSMMSMLGSEVPKPK